MELPDGCAAQRRGGVSGSVYAGPSRDFIDRRTFMRLIPALFCMLLLAVLATACGGPEEGALEASRAKQAAESGETAATTAEQTASTTAEDDMVPGTDADKVPDGDEAIVKDAPKPTGGGLNDDARKLFASSCGACHALADAGTSGAVGPSLDEAKLDAAGVRKQIDDGGGAMPPDLLSGADADAVAEYVAAAAGK